MQQNCKLWKVRRLVDIYTTLGLSCCNPDYGISESMMDTAANRVAPGYLDRLLHQDESVLAMRRPNSSWWGAFV